MKTRDSEGAKDRCDEVKELLERCRVMESELAEIKDRLAQIQGTVDRELERKRSRGTSFRAAGARSLKGSLYPNPFLTPANPALRITSAVSPSKRNRSQGLANPTRTLRIREVGLRTAR